MVKKIRIPAILLMGILALSCKQNAIFYAISQEVEPVDPKIAGMPTNIVKLGDIVYVASRFSGKILKYSGGAWSDLDQQPGGKILELAATANNLYALAGDPGSAVVSRYDGAAWQTLTADGNLQVIYAAEEYVFAGAMSGSSFDILYAKDDENSLTSLKTGTKLLKGAAFLNDVYYLATSGDGILTFRDGSIQDDPVGIKDKESAKIIVTGIITVKDTVVAVSRGDILYGPVDGKFTAASGGVVFTGGLGLWENDDASVKLLLLGIQGGSSSTSHGYREIVLNADGTLITTLNADGTSTTNTTLNNPGGEKSTITNVDKYNSSLRRHPVIGFLQAPDKILFASTTKDGLWAYRNEVWNAEQ
ncbi:MAG: hypothetical protein LBG73_11350 [Spirochaetaceae bacterium]|jgi:hypothetical protein|nr:hypothetical protein [Spirochaetaceae bacterium]